MCLEYHEMRNTFSLEKFGAYFKLNSLSKTKLRTYGSFELVPKRKTQSDTASKEEKGESISITEIIWQSLD